MEFIRYKRGTIWFYKDKDNKLKNLNDLTYGEQLGSRPVLIISNDKFNSYSPVVNVICLTSQNKDNIVHEKINIEGKNNIKIPINGTIFELSDSMVLCEQIKTVSTKELTYLGYDISHKGTIYLVDSIVYAQGHQDKYFGNLHR